MKSYFPILQQHHQDKVFIYFDSAATSQMPQMVLDAIQNYYQKDHSNTHRGIHFLGERATQHFENARDSVKSFLHASNGDVVFTSGTTHAINLIANAYLLEKLEAGDLICLSPLEHHSNYLPWLEVAQKKQAQIIHTSLDANFKIDADSIPYSNPRLKLIAITHVSNVTGGLQPVEKIAENANVYGVPLVVDGAQAVSHQEINLEKIGASFYAFSGHKMHALTGIGGCFIRKDQLPKMKPFLSGGGMVESIENNTYQHLPLPYGLEAGTPNIAGCVSLQVAIEFIQNIKRKKTPPNHQENLIYLLLKSLSSLNELRMIVDKTANQGILSFSHETIHPHDLAGFLSNEGICIRAGHHCAKPFLESIQERALCRVSLDVYNTETEILTFTEKLQQAISFFTSDE